MPIMIWIAAIVEAGESMGRHGEGEREGVIVVSTPPPSGISLKWVGLE